MAQRLTGIGESAEILSTLNREHFFTERHASSDPAYHYHPLFRDFLLNRARTEFAPDGLQAVRQKAAALLEEAGQVEDAASLLRESGKWDGFIRLILCHARSLTEQRRVKTLLEWLLSVPHEALDNIPWLRYWLGVCKLSFNPGEARLLFEGAFQSFEKSQDDAGMLLACAGAMNSVHYEYDDFTLYDKWIAWLDERMKVNPSFPSPRTADAGDLLIEVSHKSPTSLKGVSKCANTNKANFSQVIFPSRKQVSNKIGMNSGKIRNHHKLPG